MFQALHTEESTASELDDEKDVDFYENVDKAHHFPNQLELNDLIKDLGLTKDGAELLTSRLSEWNLLGEDCKITTRRNRHKEFAVFYDVVDNLCFCKDVSGLFQAIGIEHVPRDWRLFIDSSTRSLKAVLLRNGNKFPSIPVAHSVQMKEDYETVKKLLIKVKYEEYQWEVRGDFKMILFLLGLQGG